MDEKNAWVVIAAYNEGRAIRKVVEGVRAVLSNVVVVDDCSKDDTSQEALAGGAVVLRHVINRGQGAALQTGTDYAVGMGASAVIHFDADGQHQPGDIQSFLKALTPEVDVILGSRFLSLKSNVPTLRRLVLKGGILFTWLFSGIKLTDTHNGFRAFSRRAALAIRIRENRMAHASEILHELYRLKLAWKEIPVTILYTDYSKSRGQSSLNAFSIVGRLVWRKMFID